MQRKFIEKALLLYTLLQQIRVETPVLTYDETAVTAKMECSGKNVTSLLSSRQSTSDH
jgi:hypothetical protein